MSNIDGSKTKINGIKKPANDSFNAWKPVFIGSPSAIPAPAKVAKATGGVTLAKIPNRKRTYAQLKSVLEFS